jgi:uncharacterized protein YidB (DUF937 family)
LGDDNGVSISLATRYIATSVPTIIPEMSPKDVGDVPDVENVGIKVPHTGTD